MLKQVLSSVIYSLESLVITKVINYTTNELDPMKW